MLPGHGPRYRELFAGGLVGLAILGVGWLIWNAARWWWQWLAG